MFRTPFTGTVYASETISHDVGDLTVTATIYSDDDTTPPWEREDGHGPVSEWTTRAKSPGELVLNEDRGRKRFYDYAEACRIARADGWGPAFYRQDVEEGANGLRRIVAHWYIGKDLHTATTDWYDDVNDAYTVARKVMRDSYPSARAYAAAAALSDFERLRTWCADLWQYIGVSVVVSRDGEDLTTEFAHACWGIESDCPEYITEVAAEHAADALASLENN